jgi:3',5'-cyclic-AMP phosphodiesterase
MTVTVLQLSDIHLTATGGELRGTDPDFRLATVLAAWEAVGKRVDLVLLTGDNADDGSEEAYVRLAAALAPLDAPVVALPGNHDVPATLAAVFGPPPLVELGAWRIVGFDTSRPGQIHGTLDVPATLDLLDHLDERPTVVALHHPPTSASTHDWFQLDGGADLVLGLGERPWVRAVASGHLHAVFELEGPSGLALLGGPSTYTAISHDGDACQFDADEPRGARVLSLHDDGTLSSTILVA